MTIYRVQRRPPALNLVTRRTFLCSAFLNHRSMSVSSQATMENVTDNRELFEYTSGRWIYNETRRMAERRLVFNVDELKKAAAKSVNKPTSDVKSLRKIAEGGFNRVFEIEMRDGLCMIARIPYPSTLPKRQAVASEVATLSFLRAKGIPTPKVLGYSADENPVGADYILMEKLSGTPLGDAWFDLSEQERLKIILQIVQLETKLFAIDLPASGSIYFDHDLTPDTPRIDISGSDRGLCIGPYAALRWWFGERADMKLDRGPHDDPNRVLQAPAERELAWIRAYGRPRFPFDRAYRETFGYKKQDPEEYASTLMDYIKIAPYMVPARSKLNAPILRHPDLQPNNIFVSESFTITGLIDWQHSMVLPTFLAAGVPKSFQNYNDPDFTSLAPPRLPEGFESMDEEQRTRVQEQFRRRHVHFFYMGFTERLNQLHWDAIKEETGLLKRRAFDNAGSPWEGLNVPLQMDVVRISQNWQKIVSARSDGTVTPCPITLAQQEVQRRVALDRSLSEVDSEMERITRVLGIASDGWTPNELFDDARERATLIKEEGLVAVDDDPWLKEMTQKHWPFDDWDEDE